MKNWSICRLSIYGRNYLPQKLSKNELMPKILAVFDLTSFQNKIMGCGGFDKLGLVTCPNMSVRETGTS